MKVIYGITNFGYAMAEQITGASRYKEDKDIRDAAYVQALERTNLLSFYMAAICQATIQRPGYWDSAMRRRRQNF